MRNLSIAIVLLLAACGDAKKSFDADNVIFESGSFGDDEAVSPAADPNLWLFADRMFDEDDQEVHMFWEAARVEGELMPAAVDPMVLHRVSRTFDMPSAPARVTMRMRMRPIDLDLIESLSGYLETDITIETFEVLDLVEWTQGGEQCVPPDVF